MANKLFWTFAVVFLSLTQCKSPVKPPDPLLLDALQIQESALILSKSADSLIAASLQLNMPEKNKYKLTQLRDSIHRWKEQLIEIPGVEANHDLHDHDHGHHHHAPEDFGLSPAQMKDVQLEWKKTLTTIVDSIRVILTEN